MRNFSEAQAEDENIERLSLNPSCERIEFRLRFERIRIHARRYWNHNDDLFLYSHMSSPIIDAS